MLYSWLYPLKDYFFGFNIFRYITFRAAMASVTAFIVSLLIGQLVIRFLHQLNLKQCIERQGFDKLYKAHEGKEKIPTMGGLLIIGAVVSATLLWADLSNRYILLSLLVFVWLGIIGFVDDYLKIGRKNTKGLNAVSKFTGQLVAGLGIGLFLYLDAAHWQAVSVPFFKNAVLALGPLYILFAAGVLVGTSNALNLTDGLDGLAIGCTAMVALTYAVFSYIAGHAVFSQYLQVAFIPGAGELAVFCASLFGAGIGFLWFNSYPAAVFMGDVGSLSLGGALGVVALFVKKELLLVVVGGVFVIEAVSVILQVASFRLLGKRIFLMSPLHHHFQLKGIPESKVVMRFWIVSVLLALFGLAALKLQ